MERTDENVRGIVNLIIAFFSNCECLMLDTTDPAASQEQELIDSLNNILDVKHTSADYRWSRFIAINMRDMLSSHEAYITYVIFACCLEEYVDSNIFERFINVCCTTIAFSIFFMYIAGVNFYKSNVDIIMVYYEKKLKKKFNKCGGFRRLVEYILQHEYATWGPSDEGHGSYYDSRNCQVITTKNLKEKLTRETQKIESQRFLVSKDMTIATSLASEVLAIAKAELPILPSPEDLEVILREFAKEEIAEKQKSEKMVQNPNEFDVDPPGELILNSSPEPEEAEPKMNGALCEKIVEAVVRHNTSKSSLKASSDDIFYIQASPVLHHLKDTVKSLIRVLEQIDKE